MISVIAENFPASTSHDRQFSSVSVEFQPTILDFWRCLVREANEAQHYGF
jgi:hypothetical protein